MLKCFCKENMLLLFCFLGPLGNLIPIFPMVSSFRFFYIVVFLGAVTMILCKRKTSMEKNLTVIYFPLIIYSVVSLLVYMAYSENDGVAENPLVRFFLLVLLFLFSLYVSSGNNDIGKIRNSIKIYVKGYTMSLIAGYAIFVGFYVNIISFDTLKYIEVLPQMGYGLLRFSPGSYANEYGNVSSFVLSIITYCFIFKVYYFSKMKLILLYFFTFIALILTTTRAAYISYCVCFLFLLVRRNMQGNSFCGFKILLMIIATGWISLLVVQNYVYDMVSVFSTGYDAFVNNEGSSAERIYTWEKAVDVFLNENYLFGLGFGTLGYLHNIYFQLLFELGLFGVILIIAPTVFLKVLFVKFVDSKEINIIVGLGWIHVLMFGLSNHNLNHHLTWFVIILTLLLYKTKKLVLYR